MIKYLNHEFIEKYTLSYIYKCIKCNVNVIISGTEMIRKITDINIIDYELKQYILTCDEEIIKKLLE